MNIADFFWEFIRYLTKHLNSRIERNQMKGKWLRGTPDTDSPQKKLAFSILRCELVALFDNQSRYTRILPSRMLRLELFITFDNERKTNR